MAKFKVGDKVRVVKVLPEYDKILGATGEIVSIDEDWDFPYEVKFDNEEFEKEVESGWLQSLFAHNELAFFGDRIFHVGDEIVVVDKDETSFMNIKFQEGTVADVGVNGVQIEDVIDLLVDRLTGFQKGGYPCRENALAITHLQEAQNWLYRRTRERQKKGVEGKYEKHE